ncbi:MAG: hypothetical protein DRJ42_30855 [Deltaproteobacteria bacterium]|nr:MAG: hypothetical protein DRJ42_30855 [Deltaproteobacteria bacterium]
MSAESRRGLLRGDSSGRRAIAIEMALAAVRAVDPVRVTREAVADLRAHGELPDAPVVIALGKAAMGMARGAFDACRPRGGLLIGLDAVDLCGVPSLRAEHPVSGAIAIANGEALLRLAETLGAGDTVLCLISGGGSAMAEVPVLGVDASCLAATQEVLLASGAPIGVVNAVRGRLSRLKNGGLLRALLPARVITLVLSDTPHLSPAVVASGPTAALPRSPSLEELLAMDDLVRRLPSAAFEALRRAGAERPTLAEAPRLVVAADNATAQRAAIAEAERHGLSAAPAPTALSGQAHLAGARLCREGRAADVDVLVSGGETTVVVRGQGRGGRSHELCLGGASKLAGGLLVGFGTDGVDGTSGAAGAMIDEAIMDRASALGLDEGRALASNDSAAYFARAEAQIVTGPTGTNVADLAFYFP